MSLRLMTVVALAVPSVAMAHETDAAHEHAEVTSLHLFALAGLAAVLWLASGALQRTMRTKD